MNTHYLQNREQWLAFKCAILENGINPSDVTTEPGAYDCIVVWSVTLLEFGHKWFRYQFVYKKDFK